MEVLANKEGATKRFMINETFSSDCKSFYQLFFFECWSGPTEIYPYEFGENRGLFQGYSNLPIERFSILLSFLRIAALAGIL